MQLTTRNLARLRELYKNLAISQRELDQAASDQQTAKAIRGLSAVVGSAFRFSRSLPTSQKVSA
jgi:multidrug resistance efflux pump